MKKNDYEMYIDDYLKISPELRFIYGKRDKETLSHITNNLSEDYINQEKKIIEKYKNTKHIELIHDINDLNYLFNNKLNLFIFSSYNNFIINYYYDEKYIYPKNELYKKSRQNDFNELVKNTIIKANEGLKANITFPKVIIKKFLLQIKSYPKYSFLYNFINKHYYPYCRIEPGLCYIKNGKDIYKTIIKSNIGYLDITPEEIHKLGLSLIKSKIKTGDTYKSKKEFINDCHKYANYIYDNIIDKYFDYKLKKRFVIKEVNKSLEKSTPLAYYNEIEKTVFINTSYYYEIEKKNLYSLIMHECMHYYHFEYIHHLNIPKYKIYDYSNTALIEGFAHYMEIYCEDYNDDNNPYSLLRKLRLVADTGINYYGWTFKQTLDYLNKYLPKQKQDNINEVERYICLPGQALSYLIGKLHIIKLRDYYLNKGGNIKDFHHKLLSEGHASFITINKQFDF